MAGIEALRQDVRDEILPFIYALLGRVNMRLLIFLDSDDVLALVRSSIAPKWCSVLRMKILTGQAYGRLLLTLLRPKGLSHFTISLTHSISWVRAGELLKSYTDERSLFAHEVGFRTKKMHENGAHRSPENVLMKRVVTGWLRIVFNRLKVGWIVLLPIAKLSLYWMTHPAGKAW